MITSEVGQGGRDDHDPLSGVVRLACPGYPRR